MIHGFKDRRPWAAVLVTLIFGTVLGMLYLGRGRIALGLLAIGTLFGAFLFVYIFPIAITRGYDSNDFQLWAIPFNIMGGIFAWYVASRPSFKVPQRWFSRWYFLTAVALAPICLALGIRNFLYQPFNVPSESMIPSLNVGDYFFISHRSFDWTNPARGDLIVFRRNGISYVKRIVGIPGDRIQMRGGRLILNGAPISRMRVDDFTLGDFATHPVRQYIETLPSGRAYRTLDSMDGSPEDDTDVFQVPDNSYFVLGDNRDNSDDSRVDVGYVPRDAIAGRVVAKFMEGQHPTLEFKAVE